MSGSWQQLRTVIADAPPEIFANLSSAEHAFYKFLMTLSDAYYEIAIGAFPRFYGRIVSQARSYAPNRI